MHYLSWEYALPVHGKGDRRDRSGRDTSGRERSGRDTSGRERSGRDRSGLQWLGDLPAWLQVGLAVAALLVAGGGGAAIHAAVTHNPSSSPSSSPAITASSSSTPTGVAPAVIFDNQVAFVAINFDDNPPRSYSNDSSGPWTLNYYAPGLNASFPGREAIWTDASPPSYAECREWAITNSGSNSVTPQNGMKLCVESAGGRVIFLKITDVGSNSVITADATVWA
jgi:hypothetical protein